jgi:hypothetical protein
MRTNGAAKLQQSLSQFFLVSQGNHSGAGTLLREWRALILLSSYP